MSEKSKGIVIQVSPEFNLKLKKHLLALEEIGIEKTKSELLTELAQLGFKYI